MLGKRNETLLLHNPLDSDNPRWNRRHNPLPITMNEQQQFIVDNHLTDEVKPYTPIGKPGSYFLTEFSFQGRIIKRIDYAKDDGEIKYFKIFDTTT